MGAYDAALKFLLTNIQDNAPHVVAQVAQGHLAALAEEEAEYEKHLDLDSDCHDPNCFICSDPQVKALVQGQPWDETKSPKPLGLLDAADPEITVLSGSDTGSNVDESAADAVLGKNLPIAEGDGNAPA
jgi:hypothetical protein